MGILSRKLFKMKFIFKCVLLMSCWMVIIIVCVVLFLSSVILMIDVMVINRFILVYVLLNFCVIWVVEEFFLRKFEVCFLVYFFFFSWFCVCFLRWLCGVKKVISRVVRINVMNVCICRFKMLINMNVIVIRSIVIGCKLLFFVFFLRCGFVCCGYVLSLFVFGEFNIVCWFMLFNKLKCFCFVVFLWNVWKLVKDMLGEVFNWWLDGGRICDDILILLEIFVLMMNLWNLEGEEWGDDFCECEFDFVVGEKIDEELLKLIFD